MESEQGTFFTATGDLTCHRFIRSVREHGIRAGKQRDDSWMADHASIRFDGGALEWFEGLDDSIQTDWKLLRRAILARYAEPAYGEADSPQAHQEIQPTSLMFRGENEKECWEFVSQIRQRAVAEGRENDSEWMVRLAFPCFLGRALEWHASLPIDVRSNWGSLEREILLDYPHQPTSPVFSPARIQINDWYSFVSPTSSLQSIRSHTDWIAQATERRNLYQAADNRSTPCWLLIESERSIPDNAIRTGTDWGGPLYSVRAWYKNVGLLVGKAGPHLPGAVVAFNSEEIQNITPFEILVGDLSHFKWVAVPDKWTDHRAIC